VIVGDAYGRPLVEALERRADLDDLLALNVILSGGAVLSPSTTVDLLRLLPWAMVVDGFGASETGGQGQRVTYPGVREGALGPARFRMGGDTAVLDDDLRPLAGGDGRTGWLARRGHIPLGYLHDPDGTEATFPVVDGVRWALSGDRATVEADGSVVVLGRGWSSISTGGERVQAEEVEAVVRTHPAVADAVVVGVADERWGEVVQAVVALRPDRALTLEDLADHCRAALAGYKVPRRLVVVDAVVRTPSGKPDVRWARTVGG
jgi:acyl-CoA synthetase (AMP-forming)/AMP-acid ligase II